MTSNKTGLALTHPDTKFMSRAISLARVALGSTSPNPAVGAVVVKDGHIVGEGYTLPPGQRHAEIGALEQAGGDANGAVLYCTLEPCCHYGRTPPCTDAVIAAGIAQVFYGATDPNPRVSGGGEAALQAAGISAGYVPTLETVELYEGFAKHVVTGQPFVVAKFAMSLDGKIATHTGDSKWITGEPARSRVQEMRKELDAIVVGIETVLADDPQLTARDGDGLPLAAHLQPVRVVVDSEARTPVGARMLQEPGRTIVAVGGNAAPGRVGDLRAAGAEVRLFPGDDRRVDLAGMLMHLGDLGLVNVLVEGGGTILGSMLDAGLIDKVHVFIGAMLIGGIDARSPIEGRGAGSMRDVWDLRETRLEQLGPDWLITGYPHRGSE